MSIYLFFVNFHYGKRLFMGINIGSLVLFIVMMLIGHRFAKVKEYLPNIFKVVNISICYENIIYLISEEEETKNLGFLLGYFTSLYINNQRELYENHYLKFCLLTNVYFLIRTIMIYNKSIFYFLAFCYYLIAH